MAYYVKNLWKDVTGSLTSITRIFGGSGETLERTVIREIQTIAPHGRMFVRIAGFSGMMAVVIGAYGAHVFRHSSEYQDLKETFDAGYRLHLIHSVALLATPLTNRPTLVGTLMTLGIVLFSGSCYYHAFTGKTHIRVVTPYGGTLLIIAWLAAML